MEQIKKRLLSTLPLSIALFDGDGGNGGGNDSGNAAGNAAGNPSAQANDGAHPRNGRGQFARGSDGGDGGQRVYATDLSDANRRIGELQTESATRRRENNELKAELSTVKSRQTLVDQRAIRMEAREALRAKGVIDPDVVDLFLKHAGDTIKIDEQTGDVVGIDGAVAKFQEAKPVFFKPADDGGANGGGQAGAAGNGDGSGSGAGSGNGAGSGANSGGSGAGAAGDNRGNATGTGSSVAGGGSSGEGGFKVANFRDPGVNADAAMERYMQSLR